MGREHVVGSGVDAPMELSGPCCRGLRGAGAARVGRGSVELGCPHSLPRPHFPALFPIPFPRVAPQRQARSWEERAAPVGFLRH